MFIIANKRDEYIEIPDKVNRGDCKDKISCEIYSINRDINDNTIFSISEPILYMGHQDYRDILFKIEDVELGKLYDIELSYLGCEYTFEEVLYSSNLRVLIVDDTFERISYFTTKDFESKKIILTIQDNDKLTDESIITLSKKHDVDFEIQVPYNQSGKYEFDIERSGDYWIAIYEPSINAYGKAGYIHYNDPSLGALELEIIMIFDESHYGMEDGSLNVEATGGYGEPYIYRILNFDGEIIQENINGRFSNLTHGEYIVQAVDQEGEEIEKEFKIKGYIQEELTSHFDIIVTDVSSFGNVDGKIEVVFEDEEYGQNCLVNIKNENTYKEGNPIYDVEPGEYDITIISLIDDRASKRSVVVDIKEPLNPVLSCNFDISKYNENGVNEYYEIEVEVEERVGLYNYSLYKIDSDGRKNLYIEANKNSNKHTFGNILTGNYLFEISHPDSNSRFISEKIPLLKEEKLSNVDIEKQDITLYGGNDGKITYRITENLQDGFKLILFKDNKRQTNYKVNENGVCIIEGLGLGIYYALIENQTTKTIQKTETTKIYQPSHKDVKLSLMEETRPSGRTKSDGVIRINVYDKKKQEYVVKIFSNDASDNKILFSENTTSKFPFFAKNLSAGNYEIGIYQEDTLIKSEFIELKYNLKELDLVYEKKNKTFEEFDDGYILVKVENDIDPANLKWKVTGPHNYIKEKNSISKMNLENLKEGTYVVSVVDLANGSDYLPTEREIKIESINLDIYNTVGPKYTLNFKMANDVQEITFARDSRLTEISWASNTQPSKINVSIYDSSTGVLVPGTQGVITEPTPANPTPTGDYVITRVQDKSENRGLFKKPIIIKAGQSLAFSLDFDSSVSDRSYIRIKTYVSVP